MGYSIKGTAATKGWRSIQKAEDVQLHHWVTLNDHTVVAEFHQDPKALFGLKINAGDLVTLVSGDGETIFFGCFVKSNVGGIYLDAPLRMTGLSESPLYGSALYEVKPVGKQFGVFASDGAEPLGQLWATARAAETDIHRRTGSQA
jgi:hypothetical protein